jgi:hypothetical protein
MSARLTRAGSSILDLSDDSASLIADAWRTATKPKTSNTQNPYNAVQLPSQKSLDNKFQEKIVKKPYRKSWSK